MNEILAFVSVEKEVGVVKKIKVIKNILDLLNIVDKQLKIKVGNMILVGDGFNNISNCNYLEISILNENVGKVVEKKKVVEKIIIFLI